MGRFDIVNRCDVAVGQHLLVVILAEIDTVPGPVNTTDEYSWLIASAQEWAATAHPITFRLVLKWGIKISKSAHSAVTFVTCVMCYAPDPMQNNLILESM